MIAPRQESLLTWFFGLGSIAFERSTAGAMLERQKLFSEAQNYPGASWPKVVAGEVVYSDHEITARPTAELRNEGSHAPDDETLIRYALVSRRLKLLEARDPVSCQVLEFYFGDLGERWALTKQGRLVAVYALTASGKKLVRASAEHTKKGGAHLDLSPHARLEVIVLQSPSQERKESLARAAREAEQMLAQACELWNDITASAEPKRVTRP